MDIYDIMIYRSIICNCVTIVQDNFSACIFELRVNEAYVDNPDVCGMPTKAH